MVAISYTSITKNSVDQYSLAERTRSARTPDSPNNSQPERAGRSSLLKSDRVELSNTVAALSNKAYSELRGQVENASAVTDIDAAEWQDDEGYWSSGATATRIVDLAKGLAGGDSERAKIITDAVKKGFEDAQYAARGEMPEVSLRTQESVFTQLDSWMKSIS